MKRFVALLSLLLTFVLCLPTTYADILWPLPDTPKPTPTPVPKSPVRIGLPLDDSAFPVLAATLVLLVFIVSAAAIFFLYREKRQKKLS